MSTENLVFNLNKNMPVRMGIGVVLFLSVGVWLAVFFRPHNYVMQYIFIGLGVLCLMLGAWLLVMLIKKLTGPKEGIIVTSEGIIEQVNQHGVPMIYWKDIKGIREEMVFTNKFIRIDVYNPDDYIGQAKNAVQRRMMKNNFKMYGSPFLVTSKVLGIRHNDLMMQLNNEFAPIKQAREEAKKEANNTEQNENAI